MGVHDAEKLCVLHGAGPCSPVRLDVGGLRSRLGVAWRGDRCSGTHIHQTTLHQVRGQLLTTEVCSVLTVWNS